MSQHKLITYFKDALVNKSLKVLLLRVSGVFFFFALSLFLTNFYDPELVGKYDFTRATLLILGGITMFGTNEAIIFYSGVLRAQDSIGGLYQVYKKMLRIIFVVALLFLLLFWITPNGVIDQFFEKEGVSSLLFKIVLTLIAFALTLLNIDTLRGLNQALFSELYRNIFRYLPFFLGIIVLFLTNHTEWLVEMYLLGFFYIAATSSLRVYQAFRKGSEISHVRPFSYNNILKKSYPMALSSVAYFLMQSTDIVLLGKFTNFDTVAFYAIAVKLSIATSLALQSVNVIIAPKIAEVFKKNDRPQLKQILKNSTRLIISLSLPILIILSVFASFFLGLFGEEYKVAKSALLILLVGQFFNTLSGPVGVYMNMTGKQNKLQLVLIFGFITNLILNWFLIPEYGMIGAASATAISVILWKSIAVIYTYRKDKIKTFLS
jgi:O-antigen/teichoic acid export membrane protein